MQVSLNDKSTGINPKIASYVLNDLWEELLMKNGACWARVVSDSMYPVIRRGNQVLVEKAFLDKIRFGDIVVFKRGGMLTIHRSIGRREIGGRYHFLEKGDANLQAKLIRAKSIIGRVTLIRTIGGPLRVIHGSGRWLQLALACISYTSFHLWTILRHCLARGGRTSRRRHYGVVYKKFFASLHRIAIQIFL